MAGALKTLKALAVYNGQTQAQYTPVIHAPCGNEGQATERELTGINYGDE